MKRQSQRVGQSLLGFYNHRFVIREKYSCVDTNCVEISSQLLTLLCDLVCEWFVVKFSICCCLCTVYSHAERLSS